MTEFKKTGVWGQRRKRYLKSHHRVLYYNYLTSGKLNTYLADIDKRAEAMNNIRARATEIVNNKLIYLK